MDERELLLGELMAEVLAALDERRFDAVDSILERAGDDRQQVLDMVEVALAIRGPAAPSAAVVDELAAAPMFDERAWTDILEPARHALGLKRPELVDRLAERLGVAGEAGRARLAERYHELESGLIPAQGVAPALTGALGDLLGGIGETLRQTRHNAAGLGPAVAFNRTGAPLDLLMDASLALPDEPTTDAERLVDDLFGV